MEDTSKGILKYILTLYFKGELKMTAEEKEIIKAALINFTYAIQDELTQKEHTTEEIQEAFKTWNKTEELIKRFSK